MPKLSHSHGIWTKATKVLLDQKEGFDLLIELQGLLLLTTQARSCAPTGLAFLRM